MKRFHDSEHIQKSELRTISCVIYFHIHIRYENYDLKIGMRIKVKIRFNQINYPKEIIDF